MTDIDDIFPDDPDKPKRELKAPSSVTFETIDARLAELFEWSMTNGEFTNINPAELSAYMQNEISKIAKKYTKPR